MGVGGGEGEKEDLGGWVWLWGLFWGWVGGCEVLEFEYGVNLSIIVSSSFRYIYIDNKIHRHPSQPAQDKL